MIVGIMDEKPKIFIAHSSEDLKDARIVRNSFEDLLHDVLLLKLSQRMNDDFLKELLSKEILARDWIIVVASKNSKRSNWVKFEYKFAKERGKPVFYIELDDCDKLRDLDRQECIQRQVKAISRRIRVFLSYNHQHDNKYAKRIANDLRTHGYEVWLDIERLEAGTDIVSVLKKEIQLTLEQGALIVLASSHGINSKWVSWEFSYALQLGGRVIPCIIEPKPNNMPFELQHIQWIDFAQSYEKGLETLIKTINSE